MDPEAERKMVSPTQASKESDAKAKEHCALKGTAVQRPNSASSTFLITTTIYLYF